MVGFSSVPWRAWVFESYESPRVILVPYYTLLEISANVYRGLQAQCPSADCEGARAFYYQVQIRSADEPMTTFLKVSA